MDSGVTMTLCTHGHTCYQYTALSTMNCAGEKLKKNNNTGHTNVTHLRQDREPAKTYVFLKSCGGFCVKMELSKLLVISIALIWKRNIDACTV